MLFWFWTLETVVWICCLGWSEGLLQENNDKTC